MHYYNRTGMPQEDASGIELCVVKGKNLRPNPAGITMGFSQLAFSIPPGAINYSVRGECTVRASQPIHLVSASPHAHRLAECLMRNDTGRDVTFGESNDTEMCFNFASYYPVGGFCCEEIGLESCLFGGPGGAEGGGLLGGLLGGLGALGS